MMRLASIPLAALLFASASPVTASVISINNGLAPPALANVIDAANSYPADDVFVQNVGCDESVVSPCAAPGDPTSVALIAGGSVGSLQAYQSSVVVMTGGSVAATRPGAIEAFGTSTVTISGGSVNGVVDSSDLATITISGGEIAGNLLAFDSSSIVLSGGSVGGFAAFDSSTITIAGTDFVVNGIPVGYGPIAIPFGALTGNLLSGDSINGSFCHNSCSSLASFPTATGLIVLVPEPGTSLMVLAGIATLQIQGQYSRRRLRIR
jgi:hypothetical protein